MKNNNLKAIKGTLMVDSILVLVAFVFSIWIVIHNEPFMHEGQEVIMSTKSQMISIGTTILTFALVAYPLYLMIKILNNLIKKQYFQSENEKYLERIGSCLSAYALTSLLGLTTDFSIFSAREYTEIANGEVTLGGFAINFSMETITLLCVICIIVALVEVIKEGRKLKEEADYTV